jgi:hypothetical protein
LVRSDSFVVIGVVSLYLKGGSTMEPRKEQQSRFQIVRLEQRIAPTPACPIPANDHALPSNNDGTLNAAQHIRSGPDQAGVALANWFGKAAC